MNLKLKCIARTANSEQVALFDADTRDESGNAVNLGKLDIHFADDQVIGTLLIWQEYATGFNRTHAAGSDYTIDNLIDDILTEATEPLGVPGEYGIEVYYPSVLNHTFVSNYSDEDAEEGAESASEYGEDEENQDDFTKEIRRYGGPS